MSKDRIAKAEIMVDAPVSDVWHALVSPTAIKEYMFGADVESDWTEGSKITWKGEFKGKSFEDKGEILTIEPDKLLKYSHFSPLAGKPDEPENYHTVTVELEERDLQTKVWLTQDNNPDQKTMKESENNWRTMLESLKKYVESLAAENSNSISA